MKPENPFLGEDGEIAWYRGFDAATEYWNEPCTEHKRIYENQSGGVTILENDKRFSCPKCQEELK